MFAGEMITSLVFKFLNFGLLIGLFIYLIKRYLWQSIKNQLAVKESLLRELKQQKENARNDLQTLENQLIEQDVLIADLSNKIERWCTIVEQHRIKKQQEKEVQYAAIIKKIEIKNHTIAFNALQKKILPEVLEAVKNTLQKKFTSTKDGKEFLAQLLLFMEQTTV